VGEKDIQVNLANKKLNDFLNTNPLTEPFQKVLNEERKQLAINETKLNKLRNEYRNLVKERIDKHLKESKSPLDMLHEGVPLGKGRYHAPYAYARKINPDVYNPEKFYEQVAKEGNELYKKYTQMKRNYLH